MKPITHRLEALVLFVAITVFYFFLIPIILLMELGFRASRILKDFRGEGMKFVREIREIYREDVKPLYGGFLHAMWTGNIPE